MSNRPEELIKKIYEEQGKINDVFLTACGGSLAVSYTHLTLPTILLV